MYFDKEDGADTYCVRCGAPIYFEIGPGPETCPACGGCYSKTDEEIARDRASSLRQAHELSTVSYHKKELISHLKMELEILQTWTGDIKPEERSYFISICNMFAKFIRILEEV